jgi:Mrp family chromosome partitioning ATPase
MALEPVTPFNDDDGAVPQQGDELVHSSEVNQHVGDQRLTRKGKLVSYNRPAKLFLDESIVSVQRYNAFGSNFFPSKNADIKLTLGITSADEGDGKTVVAANLATFFALDTEDDTVLVDLNSINPQVHNVFGLQIANPPAKAEDATRENSSQKKKAGKKNAKKDAAQMEEMRIAGRLDEKTEGKKDYTPGIMDSLRTNVITVTKTAVKGLWVVPLGDMKGESMTFDKVLELREVITTLKQQFRFVVIDLPRATHPAFPAMIASHLDGYIVVVSVGKTKKTDITNLMPFLNEGKILGFVMNRVSQGLTKT